MKIIVATHNEGKLVEIRRILQDAFGRKAERIQLISAGSLKLPDPVETGTSFEENALLKARDVARRTGLPAIADDSGLIVDVLGLAPGILSARWAGAHGHDRANNALLLAQIEDIPDEKRTGKFRCAAALVVPQPPQPSRSEDNVGSVSPALEKKMIKETVKIGDMPGTIIREPRGENGFGYDPIFVPDDQPAHADAHMPPLTSAEMTPSQKNAISHRSKAFKALVPDIEVLLK
jgi:XTP/dITP diphosphohydrolase